MSLTCKTTVAELTSWMQLQAPLALSESWDNTGLLLGDRAATVDRVQTCLTLTSETVEEAVNRRAGLVIAHHPLPFKPVSRITTDDQTGKLLWILARNAVSVYVPHTAWDSAFEGINALLATRLGLQAVTPLNPVTVDGQVNVGTGRIGHFDSPLTLSSLCKQIYETIPNCRLRGVDAGKSISRVAVACGSGGGLLNSALRHNIDLFLTGEATFHTCLEAQAAGISLLLMGHFASEQFAMVELAKRLSGDFPALQCWASEQEKDPVQVFLRH